MHVKYFMFSSKFLFLNIPVFITVFLGAISNFKFQDISRSCRHPVLEIGYFLSELPLCAVSDIVGQWMGVD